MANFPYTLDTCLLKLALLLNEHQDCPLDNYVSSIVTRYTYWHTYCLTGMLMVKSTYFYEYDSCIYLGWILWSVSQVPICSSPLLWELPHSPSPWSSVFSRTVPSRDDWARQGPLTHAKPIWYSLPVMRKWDAGKPSVNSAMTLDVTCVCEAISHYTGLDQTPVQRWASTRVKSPRGHGAAKGGCLGTHRFPVPGSGLPFSFPDLWFHIRTFSSSF